MKGFPLEFGIGARGPECFYDGATRWSKKFWDRFSRFDTIMAVTDRQTPCQPASWTRCRSKDCAVLSRRAEKNWPIKIVCVTWNIGREKLANFSRPTKFANFYRSYVMAITVSLRAAIFSTVKEYFQWVDCHAQLPTFGTTVGFPGSGQRHVHCQNAIIIGTVCFVLFTRATVSVLHCIVFACVKSLVCSHVVAITWVSLSDWKDLLPKWPIMCWLGLTYQLYCTSLLKHWLSCVILQVFDTSAAIEGCCYAVTTDHSC